MTSSIQALKELTWPAVEWGTRDKPVAIVDGRLYPNAALGSRVEGLAAYVVGINEKSFPRLCERLRVETLHLYEMRVGDLGPLLQLPDLRGLAIRWNTKLSDVAPLGRLGPLRTLVLEDTPKVRDLSPLSALTGLSSLGFSGGIWNKNTAISLEPIAALPALRELALLNLKVESGGLRPIARCKSLERLELSNQFPTADYAYLSVHLPTTQCEMFNAAVSLQKPIDGKDVMVVGSRKPFLSSRRDKEVLARYTRDFSRLQEEFASSPDTRDDRSADDASV